MRWLCTYVTACLVLFTTLVIKHCVQVCYAVVMVLYLQLVLYGRRPYTCVYFKSEFVDVYYLSFNIGTKSSSQFVCHDDLIQVLVCMDQHWTLILCANALRDWIHSFGRL